MRRWTTGIVLGVLFLAGLIYFLYQEHDYDFDKSKKSYEIVQKWDLPNELDEISGMVWLGNDKLACIQDEDGIIFIYDLKTSTVTKRIEFGEPGDYEALAILNNEFWIAESDGKLFRVKNIENTQVKADKFELEFEYKNNIEGLTASPDGKLLISVKDRNLKTDEGGYKAIYKYDPVSGKLESSPAIKINYTDREFSKIKINNPKKLIRPSDINYNPVDGYLYVLDAEIPKLLVLNPKGSIKRMHLLDPEEFFQPEGICFSPSGRMFISNEGKGGDPNILEVKLK
ncbi:SdiA-regulated domain-containing protein [Christiangramia salexigens]|uniref:SdiA-regulated family protein n=1 Tax=Christiangramia salexigens TaxID=1913577 RepID=A0A1L3J3A3_9FLAO|nr:SdiA-regulated domain-containing protein [Christiangramia salexigens]APG59596.1 hypothetical protein LPB144_03860 [Christiangramia salexigens]